MRCAYCPLLCYLSFLFTSSSGGTTLKRTCGQWACSTDPIPIATYITPPLQTCSRMLRVLPGVPTRRRMCSSVHVLGSKQRDPNPNNNSLVRKQCRKRRMESLMCRCFLSCCLIRELSLGLGSLCLLLMFGSVSLRQPSKFLMCIYIYIYIYIHIHTYAYIHLI